MPRRPLTPDELETVRINYANHPTFLIAHLVNRSERSVYQAARKMGLKKSAAYLAGPWAQRLRRGDEAGKAYRFPKGHVPANKGLRRPGWAPGRMASTQFKKGEMAGAAQHNYVPIGTLRIKDGVLARKVTDDPTLYPARRWVPVHRSVWEDANGPVPKGHVVRFKPGMKTVDEALITLDRLELVTHAENMRRNTIHRYPPELRDAIRLTARVRRAIDKKAETREEQD